jgi:ribosomal protein L12E/L44/L45/RPP1/RPP2
LQKADSIEQAKKIQAVMKDYSVDKHKAKEILDSLRYAELKRQQDSAAAEAAALAAAYAAEATEAAERREQELNKMCAEFYAVTDSLENVRKTMKKYSGLTASERINSGINYNELYKSEKEIISNLDWQIGIIGRKTGDKRYCLKRKKETSVGGN